MKIGLTIDFGMFEFSSKDAVIEKQVDLTKSAVFGLRKAEPAPDKAKKICTSVEETGFGTPVPG